MPSDPKGDMHGRGLSITQAAGRGQLAPEQQNPRSLCLVVPCLRFYHLVFKKPHSIICRALSTRPLVMPPKPWKAVLVTCGLLGDRANSSLASDPPLCTLPQPPEPLPALPPGLRKPPPCFCCAQRCPLSSKGGFVKGWFWRKLRIEGLSTKGGNGTPGARALEWVSSYLQT